MACIWLEVRKGARCPARSACACLEVHGWVGELGLLRRSLPVPSSPCPTSIAQGVLRHPEAPLGSAWVLAVAQAAEVGLGHEGSVQVALSGVRYSLCGRGCGDRSRLPRRRPQATMALQLVLPLVPTDCPRRSWVAVDPGAITSSQVDAAVTTLLVPSRGRERECTPEAVLDRETCGSVARMNDRKWNMRMTKIVRVLERNS